MEKDFNRFFLICAIPAIVLHIIPDVLWPADVDTVEATATILGAIVAGIGFVPLFALVLALPISLIPMGIFKYREKLSATTLVISCILIPLFTLGTIRAFIAQKQDRNENLEYRSEKQ